MLNGDKNSDKRWLSLFSWYDRKDNDQQCWFGWCNLAFFHLLNFARNLLNSSFFSESGLNPCDRRLRNGLRPDDFTREDHKSCIFRVRLWAEEWFLTLGAPKKPEPKFRKMGISLESEVAEKLEAYAIKKFKGNACMRRYFFIFLSSFLPSLCS